MPETDVPTGKALRVLQDVIALDGSPFNPKDYSARSGIPTPNLYRHLEILIKSGLLVRVRRSRYLPHPNFLKLLEPFNAQKVLGSIIRPLLEQAAQQIPATLHFGVLENDMVTYVAKVDNREMGLFTEENIQLEAYCSAIGKCLLATLEPEKLDDYLSAFEFPKLTGNTLTDPKAIRQEIVKTRRRGYGIDNREILEELVCIAVPVTLNNGNTIGAVSAASTLIDLSGQPRKTIVGQLNDIAEKIGNLL